eukprot:9155401-Alexandrium_andersonii.AAC.1
MDERGHTDTSSAGTHERVCTCAPRRRRHNTCAGTKLGGGLRKGAGTKVGAHKADCARACASECVRVRSGARVRAR